MNLKEALARLSAAGTDQNKKVYARHGVRPPMFGVSYATQRKLAKQAGTNTKLALGLWKSGNHDARILATMVAEPAELDAKTLETWSKDLENYVLADALANLVARTPHAAKLAKKWTASKNEWISSAGWHVYAALASARETLPVTEFARLIPNIAKGIHKSPNRTRYAMNTALIGIGSLGGALQKAAVAAARKIGAVEVDHGETGCKTPDAASYIEKTVAHRARRAEQATAADGGRRKKA